MGLAISRNRQDAVPVAADCWQQRRQQALCAHAGGGQGPARCEANAAAAGGIVVLSCSSIGCVCVMGLQRWCSSTDANRPQRAGGPWHGQVP